MIMETIKLNSTGDAVKRLQEFLNLVVDGQFGPKTEAAVKAWQEEHGLIADGVVGDKTWQTLITSANTGLKITKAFINTHITKCARKPKYLVIHYTAGASSKAGAAMANRNVFLKRSASADFCVDDDTIIQVNPDPLNYYCWAVGDGNGRYGITNKDCISIEICSNLTKGTTGKVPNHTGWYFTEEALNNAIELSKYLMGIYDIDIDHVIRHYDASHKLCPGVIGWNPGHLYDPVTAKPSPLKSDETKWIEFKNKLK